MRYLLFLSLALQPVFSVPHLEPRQASCGIKGYETVISSYSYYGEESAVSFEGCGARCQGDFLCQSFALTSYACYLYFTTVSSNVQANSSSPYTFYDKSCVASLRASSSSAAATSSDAVPTTSTSTYSSIVSPTSCLAALQPTGTPIGESDSEFSAANDGLEFQQFPGSQLVLQNATVGPIYADFSDPSALVLADDEGLTLILYMNGTFAVLAGGCEVQVVGIWQDPTDPSSIERRNVHDALCGALEWFCKHPWVRKLASFGESLICETITDIVKKSKAKDLQNTVNELCHAGLEWAGKKLCQACKSTTKTSLASSTSWSAIDSSTISSTPASTFATTSVSTVITASGVSFSDAVTPSTIPSLVSELASLSSEAASTSTPNV